MGGQTKSLRWFAVLGAMIGILATACIDSGQDQVSRTSVSDSAGVRVVDSRGPDRPITIRETVRVGVVQGDPNLQFHQIRNLAVETSGGFRVSDSYESDRHPRPAMRAVAEVFGCVRAFWLEEWRAPVHFDLFSLDGLIRGSVVLPEDFVPMAVTKDRIFGSVRDELDIQYVVGFSVEEGPAPAGNRWSVTQRSS